MDIIWIGVAFIIGLSASKLKVPPLVGYLLAGLLLSFTGYEGGDVLHQVAHLGVIFLLFTVGLHISLVNILRYEVLGVGVSHLIISTILFTPICLMFGLGVEASIFVAITLGFSSTVITAKTLEDRNELGAYYGRVAIGILILQDLVAIGLIAYAGGGVPSPWALLLLGLPLLRPLLSWLLKILQRDELILLMALTLAMGGDVLFQMVNLSGELGALIMGMIFANDEKGEQLEKKLWGIKEAFMVGFFLEIGLGGFPPFESYIFIILFILLLPIKAFLFYGLFMLFKLRARTGYLSTTTLTAYSEFTLISGAVGVSTGIIPDEFIVVLGLLTGISYIINSLIVTKGDRIWDRIYTIMLRFERKTKHPDHQPLSVGKAEYLVIGLGTAGIAAMEHIQEEGGKIVGFDIDPEKIKKYLGKGIRILYADAQDSDMWEAMDLSDVKSIMIAMSSNIDLKVHIVNLIRKKNKYKENIFVMVSNEAEELKVRNAQAEPVPIPSIQIGRKIAELGMGN